MTYFSREWTEDVVLPDGKIASSVHDIERFLSQNNLAMASDYSDAFRESVRFQQEKKCRLDSWTVFLNHYKRLIWNE